MFVKRLNISLFIYKGIKDLTARGEGETFPLKLIPNIGLSHRMKDLFSRDRSPKPSVTVCLPVVGFTFLDVAIQSVPFAFLSYCM